MRIVVGYMPDRRGEDALALAALLVRATGWELVVANVHPSAWPVHDRAAVDVEWMNYLVSEAKAALDRARTILDRWDLQVPVDYVVHGHRNSGRGLPEVVEQVNGIGVMIGSNPEARGGRVGVGSTADQLLHGSSVPVLLATNGFADHPPALLTRYSVAYLGTPESRSALALASLASKEAGIPLRLLTLIIRSTKFYGSRLGFAAEEPVLAALRKQMAADLAEARTQAPSGIDVTTEIAEGDDVERALSSLRWDPGEILVCASSRLGPLRRVFLGDMSLKIVRTSPVPVAVLPRAAVGQ
ncbi:MAG: universal stress protein [Mycobacteriaceae bacterium]